MSDSLPPHGLYHLKDSWRNPQLCLSSVQFSHLVMSDSLQTPWTASHGVPCPSPTPRACSNSSSLSRWCHPTISSSVAPFSSCLQSFPVPGSFLMSQLFATGAQSIGLSASSSRPSNEYSGLISFGIDWFDLLAVQGTLKSLLQHHSSKTQSCAYSEALNGRNEA